MHEVIAKGILSAKNGMNLYRGCTHGCIYCDSRSKCYQINHTFEDIEVKKNAVDLLEQELIHKRKKCMIGTGSMTDHYMPLEKQKLLMRHSLEKILQYGYGVTVLTKSDLVLRDLDLLSQINERTKAVVQMTLTTYDEATCRIVEPHVSTTKKRFEVLRRCKALGIPTVVWMGPVLPYINDTEDNLHGILNYCLEAGVQGIMCFGMGLTLRDGNREYFYEQLDRYYPGLTQRYCREYGNAYEIDSPHNQKLMRIYEETCNRYDLLQQPNEVFHYLSEYEQKGQGQQISLSDLGLM